MMSQRSNMMSKAIPPLASSMPFIYGRSLTSVLWIYDSFEAMEYSNTFEFLWNCPTHLF
jgi:hypothetical protein